MELGFNLLFALIVALAFALWVRMRADKSDLPLRQAILLACLLALLFPFVSITDDIYATPDIVEGPTVSTSKVQVAAISKEIPFVTAGDASDCAPVLNTWEHLTASIPYTPSSEDRFCSGLRSHPI